ncbi:YheC/YheD family protein [Peribacillus cavernae]|uniref:YheC/YheD family protein n=1 Tax=Peribacillus cavernae TaxID=1674310 RepID=A0A3S0VH80_9BACI|nr:YheC/YheD family protein [Peribacillus cavernae]MDQ0220313.1 hypothetical protein [Peribacillus cavernae]RUQ31970.1 YheC/YheD family protein [Peribacillus cavernae]
MTLIGMLHHRTDPQKVRKAYAYSVVAKAEGVNFFYFTPGKVNIDTETIIGKVYENGEWIDKEFPFPDVIYNARYPVSDKQDDIIRYLYKRIPVTSHYVGDKLHVYHKIKRGKDFEQYLIPTDELTNTKKLTDMLGLYQKVIIKPASGHQGEGIVFIEKTGKGTYTINESGQISTSNKEEMLNLVSQKMKEREYVVQRFLTFQMKSGQVYDFRLHVQKNGEGKWTITSIFPRIGPIGTITSNMGSGGYTGFFDEFLQKEYKNAWYDMKRKLEQFSISFSNHFDNLYDDVSFDELGIDVGVDEDRKLWVIEVNWRPGPPVIFNCELDVARNAVLYAKYLAEKKKRKPAK